MLGAKVNILKNGFKSKNKDLEILLVMSFVKVSNLKSVACYGGKIGGTPPF